MGYGHSDGSGGASGELRTPIKTQGSERVVAGNESAAKRRVRPLVALVVMVASALAGALAGARLIRPEHLVLIDVIKPAS